jgi:glycine/D-amino acid oxidase-like deaminating enzyme/nitrite reductase/ring-hydroxylating ferredoxin subunit
MNGQSGVSKSYWMKSAAVPKFQRLAQDIDDVDVCIVGAGISGLTTAYLLLGEGKTVVVLDDGPIAGGETERTTAHITNVMDDRYFEIERMHGKKNARLVAESQTAAIDKIESIVTEEGIACDFDRTDGYLFLSEKHSVELLEKELAMVLELGFVDVALVDRLPFGLVTPALRFPRQAQFHILKYISGLCNAIEKAGGLIHCYEHVSEIVDAELVHLRTSSGRTIHARNVVIATNSPISDWVKVHTKQAAYRTYVIGATVPTGSVETALYWDTDEPYHYMRLQPMDSPSKQMLILGGEDHRTGEKNDAEERFLRLERWLHMHVPQAGEVEYRWSGQVYEPEDGLGFIGRDPAHGENVYITTGASGIGMTHGTMSGVILTDLICGRVNPWAKVYEPTRKPLMAPVEFLKENLNSVAQYAKKLMPGEVDSADDIKPGEGAIIRRGLKQIAAYKDLDGKVHELSATCKHLGAAVCWNSCEKSWDCPAHGSRYDANGNVIDGPANSNLDPIGADEKKHKGVA